MTAPDSVLITCEHGGYDIPPEVRRCFRGARDVLRSHEGWDPGALDVAVACAAALPAPLIATCVSRLVVECNRSLHHARLFSRFTKPLPREERKALISRYWLPYRSAAEAMIARGTSRHPVRHISVHSFTPVLNGVVRRLEFGILFDPARAHERTLAGHLRAAIAHERPEWRIRMNQPYRGTADGFTTFLRRRYPGRRYAGIELEINQQLLAQRSARRQIGHLLARVLGSS